jgi:hypothetical protein
MRSYFNFEDSNIRFLLEILLISVNTKVILDYKAIVLPSFINT